MSKKVLIVDDSALVRKQLRGLVEALGFEVELAKNGKEGVQKAIAENYAVITMDINMPEMDGLKAVKRIMEKNPTPILMVSSLTTEDAEATMDALELGAIDFVAKPGTFSAGLAENGETLEDKVTQLSRMNRRTLQRRRRQRMETPIQTVPQEYKSPVVISDKPFDGILLIGASTGGPALIEQICATLPPDYPRPVAIVQHMPEQFTASFAKRLNRTSQLNVVEAEHNMEISVGNIYLAPGGKDMLFSRKVSGKYVIRLDDSTKTERFFRPSVDEMMLSAAKTFTPKGTVGVLLTGIGDDGAEGMLALKQAGAYTISESEATATVYGMPRVAFERGGVSEQLPFPSILRQITAMG